MYESVGQNIPWYNKGKRLRCCRGERRRCSHLHIKAKVLLLFKEEIKHELPHKVGVQRVIDYFCPTKLEERQWQERQRGRESQHHADQSVHLVRGKTKKNYVGGYNSYCCVDSFVGLQDLSQTFEGT